MTDTNAAAARARDQALRSARTARARTIRRRVISGAVALFVAVWLMIAVVLVSGGDPALAGHTTSSATTVASNPTVTAASSGSTASTGSTGVQSTGSSSGSSGSSSSGVSSVTTSQS
jgi:uncharacterized membrane protein YgcG